MGPNLKFGIGWAEAIAIELSLCITIHLDLFTCADPSLSIFLVHSNNLGIILVTNKGHSHSKEINITHVVGHNNILDALSRGNIASFL